MAVRCRHQVVIVGRTFGARSIDWSLDRRRIGAIVRSVDRRRIGTIIWSVDRRRIGTIVRSGRDSRRIGAIGWSMYRMHIGTIIVCVGSSTVLAIRSFGWQYNASNGVVFRRQIGTESCR